MARLRNWMAEARRLEAAGDLQAAIAIHRKALVAQEETTGFGDLSAQNGLGDLYLRVGRVHDALRAYEDAAHQCEDQQLYANAIALCKKILRNAPDYAPAYRRVARLSALSGLEAEARLHYLRYRDLVTEAGDPERALDALREIVEVTGDEELTFELAEGLSAADRKAEALETLRAVRDRRDGEGRGVVLLLRQIQELQLELDPKRPPLEPEPSSDRAVRDAGWEPVYGDEHAPEELEPSAPGGGEGDLEVAAVSSSDLEVHAAELHTVLAEEEGADRLRDALRIVDRMLQLAPERVDLRVRKLELAHELGDEGASVRAYLALGECLDRELESFTLRLLSTSTDTGAVRAAIGVEDRTGSVRRS